MKKLALCFSALAFVGTVAAQDSRVSVGLEFGLPMGDFGDVSSFGIGGTLGFELPMGDNLGLIAQAGYISFLGKDYETVSVVNGVATTETVKSDAVGIIPVQVGAKYYFTDNQEGAYLGALLGLHMQSVDEVTGINLATGEVTTESKLNTNFSVAPLLGFVVGENIDLGLRYQLIMAKGVDSVGEETTVTNSYVGLRAAFMF